ncbi:MAG: hypothetical protein KFF46_04065 [Desulfobacterales bacterium]|nr:hypothetical protein [Desulfobacterales bacterium]
MTTNKPETKTKKFRKALHFCTIRLPAVFVLAPLGFVFEWMLSFPWKLALALDGRKPGSRKKN